MTDLYMKRNWTNKSNLINPLHVTGLFLYPLKTSENQGFSVSRCTERDQRHGLVKYLILFTLFCLNYFAVKNFKQTAALNSF